MDHFERGRARLLIDGRNFRTVTEHCWNARLRLEDMDREGVGAQVISPMPELLSYWFSLDGGIEICRYLNENIAGLAASARGRFFGFGAVPLQDPDAAARELPGLRAMGLAGLEVGSNVLGHSLGEERFLAFWQEVERLDLPVFVHALHPTFAERILGGDQAVNAVGFPTDTGLTISSLITGGVLQKCPGLRLAFSHGGGSFPFILPRLENAWSGAWNEGQPLLADAPPTALRRLLPSSPAAYARRLYYDTLLFDRRAIRYLLDIMGAGQLLAGTDYPFFPREQPVGATLRSLDLGKETFDAIESGNCLRFLGLIEA